MKKVIEVKRTKSAHWVGDGFPVRNIFTYNDDPESMSPFLMLDFAGPTRFDPVAPNEKRRGVGEHPHRGFETVTLVYAGEVEHRDSTGAGGIIGPGDVQWMTAASGIVHAEFHSRSYSEKGGPFELVQLWVNLPSRHKMANPAYQTILSPQIPVVEFSGGRLRVIAGNYEGTTGPAKTFSPIHLYEIELRSKKEIKFKVPEKFTTCLFVMRGSVEIQSECTVSEAELARLDPNGTEVSLKGVEAARVLLLCGEPLNEPVVGYGPFVMNTAEEIKQAFGDYQSGQMGRI